MFSNFDEFVKSRNFLEYAIPAKAGIQLFQDVLDPGFRRGDDKSDLLRDHQFWFFLILGPIPLFPLCLCGENVF